MHDQIRASQAWVELWAAHCTDDSAQSYCAQQGVGSVLVTTSRSSAITIAKEGAFATDKRLMEGLTDNELPTNIGVREYVGQRCSLTRSFSGARRLYQSYRRKQQLPSACLRARNTSASRSSISPSA